MNNQLCTLLRQEYSALRGLNDDQLNLLADRAKNNSQAIKNRLIQHKHSLEPVDSTKVDSALTTLELPEGWGDFLLSITNPLIEGIPLGMTSALISQFASDPALVLLLKLLVAYTTFVTRGKKDTENAIITRGAVRCSQMMLISVLSLCRPKSFSTFSKLCLSLGTGEPGSFREWLLVLTRLSIQYDEGRIAGCKFLFHLD